MADPVSVAAGAVTLGSPLSGLDPPFGFSLTGGSTNISGEKVDFGLTGTGTASLAGLDDIGGTVLVRGGTIFAFSPTQVSPTPEPSTMWLLGVGLVGLVGRRF